MSFHVRKDAGRPLQAGAGGEMLARFRAWDENWIDLPSSGERRRSQRLVPAETRAWVGWWDGNEFVIHRATLVDLSRGGARMILRQRLRPGQLVWACLGTPEPIDSVEAHVLDSAPTCDPGVASSVVQITRLKFNAPCPSSFFRAAGCPTD